MRVLIAALVALFAITASAKAESSWKITKDHWDASDEIGFGKFIAGFGESICSNPISCFRSEANPYRFTDPPELVLNGDCADFIYQLRWYYAWKNGLPFSHALAVTPRTGSTGDLRFNAKGNMVVARRILAWYEEFDAVQAMIALGDRVSTANFRVSPEFDRGFTASDFYSPKIDKASITAGTIIYDINGHVVYVYKVTPDGMIHYVDSNPDRAVTRGTFGRQVPRDSLDLASGFHKFRPVKLVGYTRAPDGSLVGGTFVMATNAEISDYSTEQYFGTQPNPTRDWKAAQFVINGQSLDFYRYVQTKLSNTSLAAATAAAKEELDRETKTASATGSPADDNVKGKPFY